MPLGEEAPEAPVCHFHQPGSAKDPTSMHAGADKDRMRKIEFVNLCDGDLMVNMQGFTFWDTGRWHMQDLPHDGGFFLGKGERVEEEVSERLFSGRIWARPNCSRPCNIVSCGNPKNDKIKCKFKDNNTLTPECLRDGMWCDSGNCPGGNETTCRGEVGEFIGGLPPGPLLELTLCGGRGSRIACYKDGPAYNAAECDALPTSDYYDISNVDGTSKIWAGMEVVRGRRLTGKAAPKGRFNCGAANMPHAFDMSTCPQPLRISRNDSSPHGYSANASVDEAVGCLSACNFMSQVAWAAPGQAASSWIADRTSSGADMDSDQSVSPVTAEDVARTCCECGHGVDRGLCPAPKVSLDGTVTWPPPNVACIAGCSPYANYPESYAKSMCTLGQMPSIKSGDTSIPLGEVQEIFKKWAPEAYSWQFDDMSSTYLCEGADFRLTFCPRLSARAQRRVKSRPIKTASTSAEAAEADAEALAEDGGDESDDDDDADGTDAPAAASDDPSTGGDKGDGAGTPDGGDSSGGDDGLGLEQPSPPGRNEMAATMTSTSSDNSSDGDGGIVGADDSNADDVDS